MSADPNFRVWEGVYRSFAEAPAAGPGFDGPLWRDRSIAAARDTLALALAREPIDYALRQRNAILPTLTATLLCKQERVDILDFGGGLGTGYMVLVKTMPETVERVGYTVVDVESIAGACREIFTGKSGPAFRNALPEGLRFDIVHAASVLQYIEDWQGLIARLAGYGARFLSLADIFAGDFATYVTTQHYYASRIPHWFFNAAEFTAAVEKAGYKLALRSECDGKVLGQYGLLQMDNFPAALRIAHTSNFLFCRSAS
ncbi:MAG TPA: methyltransferase, TIGR04325 family [Xanthobacteraceae bacterium]|jgi:putative methyltransferase (TIGR04325 family)|nr:methyltransferase, TIGR04325 family [Xanthobacteraceae bacterium]